MLNKLLAKKFKHEAEINVDSSRMKKSETINMCIENILDIITKPVSPSNNSTNIPVPDLSYTDDMQLWQRVHSKANVSIFLDAADEVKDIVKSYVSI